MRKWFTVLAAAVLALGLASQSFGAALPYTGIFEVSVAGLDPVVLTGSGSANVNGSGGGGALNSLGIDAGVFSGSAFVEVTDPGAAPIAAITVQAVNEAGAFDAAGSTLGGPMALPGLVQVCLYTSDCNYVTLDVPFTVGGVDGVGLGGNEVTVGGIIAISVQGATWTSGQITAMGGSSNNLTTQTITGFVHGPASGTLSTAAAAGGVVSLVTPIQISTNIGPSASLPAFAIMTLTFVPEPGTLLMVGTGLAGLGLMRLRKRSR